MRAIKAFVGMLYFYFMAYIGRSPLSIPMVLFRMGVFVVLLLMIGGRDYLVHVISGALVAITFGAGVSQLSTDINALRVSNYRYMLLSTPMGPLTYAVSSALGMSLLSLVTITVFLVAWNYVVKPSIWVFLQLMFILALTWLVGIALGFLLSVIIRTPHILFNVTDTIYSLLVYLAPVYYPLEVLPQQLRPLALISPPSQAAVLVREVAMESSIESTNILYLLTIITVTLLLIVNRLAKWKEH